MEEGKLGFNIADKYEEEKEKLRPASSTGSRSKRLADSNSNKNPGLSTGTTQITRDNPTKLRGPLESLLDASPRFAAASSPSPSSEPSTDTRISSPSVQAALFVNVDRITNENLRGVADRISDSDYKPKLYEFCLAIRALGELIAEVNIDKRLIKQRKAYLLTRLGFIATIFNKYPLFEKYLTSDGKPILKKTVQQLVKEIFSPWYKTRFIPIAIDTLRLQITRANPPTNPIEYAKQWWRYILQDIVVNNKVISDPNNIMPEQMKADLEFEQLETQLDDEKLRNFIQVRFGNYPVKDIAPQDRLSFQTGTLETQQLELKAEQLNLIQEHLDLIQELTTIRKEVQNASAQISEILQKSTEFKRLHDSSIKAQIVTEGNEIFIDNDYQKQLAEYADSQSSNEVSPFTAGPFAASSGKDGSRKAGPEYGGRRKKTQRCLRKHPHVKSMKPKKNIYCRKTKSVYKKRETKKR
jgi:hypothetical protein